MLCYSGVIGMKLVAKQLLQSIMLSVAIPAVMISGLSAGSRPDNHEVLPNKDLPKHNITVLNKNGSSEMMNLEEYVLGVVLGEVSPEFHDEALKAQAVAARTYALYCIHVSNKHSGAVCMDYSCCQAYCDADEYLSQGGSNQGLDKVSAAVENTAGEIVTYDSELICATYFASSGGMTEDALEVWGRSYPYLNAVPSPGEENCGYYEKQVTISPVQLQETLGVQLTGKPNSWFGMVKYTVGGGVDLMRIGGRLYTGVELRKLFNLRSTIISINATDDKIYIVTKGYGHRVGMSQHGANAMALNGKDYSQILSHYYANTSLSQFEYGN